VQSAEFLKVMSLKIQKPILVGGLAVTAGFLGLDMLSHAVASNGNVLMLGTMAIGGGYWIWSKGQGTAVAQPIKIDSSTLTRLSDQVKLIADQLTSRVVTQNLYANRWRRLCNKPIGNIIG
jgi:uncharacterized protein